MGTENDRKFSEIITTAWSDPAFKQRLMKDPKGVAGEYGISVPDGLEISVVENTADKIYVVLPAKPAEGALSERQLEAVVGGAAAVRDPDTSGW